MIKNILVVDEQGNERGATYLKRAKGLVKKGRARFLSETTICLACPPNMDLEDIDMSEQILENTTNTEDKYTMNYCLEQIEAIQAQAAVLNQTMERILTMEDDAEVKIHALLDMVKCRETTNQQLLAFYQKMYEDLKVISGGIVAQKAFLQERAIAAMEHMMIENGCESHTMMDAFNATLESIRHLDESCKSA